MRPRPAFYLVVVLVVAATTVLLKPRKPRFGWAIDPTNRVVILVAGRDLPAGALLTNEVLNTSAVDRSRLFPSNLRPEDVEQWQGRRLRVALSAGEPLRAQDVGGRDPVGAVAKRGRAATIDVEGHRAVDGRLSPSDHVDVLITTRDPQTNELLTRTMLQNVVVLGVTHRPAPELDSVTLLVLEEEAEMLGLSQDVAKFSLSLRNPEDSDVEEEPTRATINTLLSGERLHLISCHRRALEVIRGDARP